MASFLIKIKEGKDAITTFSQYATPILDDIVEKFDGLSEYLKRLDKNINESLEMAKDNKETIEKGKVWRLLIWWVLVPSILIVGAIMGLLKYKDWREKQVY